MATFFVKVIRLSPAALLVRENPQHYLEEFNRKMKRIFAVQHQKFQLVEVMYHIPGQLLQFSVNAQKQISFNFFLIFLVHQSTKK